MTRQRMSEGETLEMRFPELDFRRTSPGLFRLNGCGLGLYFSKDRDRETGTYVKSHCACVLWIPIFPIAEYRVADADGGGWYIVGRNPLNGLHRAVRGIALAAVALVVAGIAFSMYTSSDSYQDAKALDRGTELVDRGDLDDAARTYRRLAKRGGDVAVSAREELTALVAKVGPDTDVEMARIVFESAHTPGDGLGPVVPSVWSNAVAWVGKNDALRTREALDALELFSSVAEDEAAVSTAQRDLLERIVSSRPTDIDAASELAVLLESGEELARAVSILEPHALRLGAREGARVLGQAYAAMGRFEDALPLLQGYTNARLATLSKEGPAFEEAIARAQKRAFAHLDRGNAKAAWYQAYDRASEAEQQEMIAAQVSKLLEDDDQFVAARTRYVEASAVVPVAMDLGIVRMQRAHGMTDEFAARREMEAAEQTFSAIHGAAQGDPDFLLASARVAFWLGKRDQCRALLDEVLVVGGEAFDVRYAVGGVLRALGESRAALETWEAAYSVATSDEEKQEVASSIGAILGDPHEASKWFQRSDPDDPLVRALHADCRARLAMLAGDLVAARREFTACIEAYDRLPRSAVTLHNSGVAAYSLVSITGEVALLDDAVKRLRAGLAEMPTDVSVMTNTARALATSAWSHALAGDIDLRTGLRTLISLSYDNAEQRGSLRASVRESAEMQEATQILERALALGARGVPVITLRAEIANDFDDVARLRALLARVIDGGVELANAEDAHAAARAAAADTTSLGKLIAESERSLAESRAEKGSPTRVALRLTMLQLQRAAVSQGIDGDLNTVDQLAQALYREHPSSSTRATVSRTAGLQLHTALLASNERYASEWKRCSVHVDVTGFLAEALHRDEALRSKAVTTPEFQRLLGLYDESARRFPRSESPRRWAITRFGTSEQAARALASVRANETGPLSTQIHHHCAPHQLSAALAEAWRRRVSGDESGADAVLDGCAALGAPIPYRE